MGPIKTPELAKACGGHKLMWTNRMTYMLHSSKCNSLNKGKKY